MECIQLSLFGKTSPEHSVPTEEKISEPCWKNLPAWSNQTLQFLDLRVGGDRWSKAGAIAGNGWSLAWRQLDAQYWGSPPREESVSLLSQILEVNVPQKYYLSARACQGILTRASRRGKPLPELLEQALLGMIEYLELGTLPQVKQKVKEQEGRFEKELDEYWNQTIERLRLDAQNL